ncbi:hypothetical protein Mgra_00007345, partial [Meloidogyne graminicola]
AVGQQTHHCAYFFYIFLHFHLLFIKLKKYFFERKRSQPSANSDKIFVKSVIAYLVGKSSCVKENLKIENSPNIYKGKKERKIGQYNKNIRERKMDSLTAQKLISHKTLPIERSFPLGGHYREK